MKRAITVKRMLSVDGRKTYKPWEECTEEEIAKFRRKAPEAFGKAVSDYINSHPEFLESFCSERK